MIREIRLFAVAAAAFLALASAAQAQPRTFNDFAKGYLASIRARNTPVLFAQCSIPPDLVSSNPGDVGKFILLLPLGSFTGIFAEFWRDGGSDHAEWEWSNVAAEIELIPKVSVGGLGNGGVYTYIIFREEVKFLLTQPFSFLRPDDFEKIAALDPAVTCPDVDFDPQSPTGISPSKDQEPLIITISIQRINMVPEERVARFRIDLGCADLVSISGIPRDWYLVQDNKTNCETSVTGNAIQAAGGLDEKALRKIEVRFTPHYNTASSLTGQVSVTKDFVNERKIDLTSSDFREELNQ